MRPRTTTRVYMVAARLWLTLAAVSLLLPEADRIGVWLPLHLALAGAVSTAISGAMQNFVLALTASPTPPEPVIVAQFVLVTAGAAVIALERILGHELGVALGGMLFLLGMALLGWIVLRARRRSLHKRHALPLTMYAAAIVAILVGGTFGAVVGGGAVEDETWLGLRQAHMTVNVLGWVSLTIAGTLVTFLPTVLRIRMPTWHGWATVGLLVGGLAAIATGIAIRIEPLAGLGGVTYAAGALGVAWLVVKVMRTPRTWPVPIAAKHLLLAIAWFEVGALALAVALVRGLDAFAAFREPFLAIFGLGGAVQTLALNAGVLLLALAGAGWVSGTVGAIGAGLALGGGGLALLKAWTFAALARLPVLPRRPP